MKILAISPQRDDVSMLLEQARDYAENLYPGGSVHNQSAAQLSRPNVHVIGVFEQQVLAGIGAVKMLDHDLVYGEIKSIFVLPEFRGQGVAKLIMESLECHLSDQGIMVSRLETGVPLTGAISLYHSLGYQQREAFGNYLPDPLSMFMQKELRR